MFGEEKMKEYGAMRKGFNIVTVLICALYLYIIKQDIRIYIYMLRKAGWTDWADIGLPGVLYAKKNFISTYSMSLNFSTLTVFFEKPKTKAIRLRRFCKVA